MGKFHCEQCLKCFNRSGALAMHKKTHETAIDTHEKTHDEAAIVIHRGTHEVGMRETDKKPTIQEILKGFQKKRNGQVTTLEPSAQNKLEMKQAFTQAPNNRKSREHFAKKLTPDQYLLYLEHLQEESAKKVYHLPKPVKNQSKASVVVDAETQSERPAFVMPVLHAVPKQTT